MSTTRYIVDNQSGQTINGETVLRPYNVFTALLTQNDASSLATLTNNPLTIGVTYEIQIDSNVKNTLGGRYDFTNVGAPDNEIGTKFIATGTDAISWQGAILIYNEGAPVVTVLENNIGNIWFEYNFEGQYILKGSFLELIDVSKIFIQIGKPNTAYATIAGYVDLCQVEGPNIYITTKDFDDNLLSNGVLSVTPIEIRVYD